MRILFITAEYPPENIGGAGLSSRLIVEALRDQGHEVAVVATTGLSPEDTNAETHRPIPDGTGYPILPQELGINLSVFRNLPDCSDYDIVHAYNTGHVPGTVLASDTPVIATINNHMWVCIDPSRYLREEQPSSSLIRAFKYSRSTGYTGLSMVGRVAAELCCRSLVRRATLHTVQTQGMADVLINTGFDPDSIRVIPNLVDPAFMGPDLPSDGDRQTLIFVGRLVEHKGPLEVVEAFSALPEQLRKQWRLKIYGNGPLRDEIEERIVGTDSDTKITIEYCPYEDLPSVYQRADAMIHASRYTEPFSRTWLEAMASETPILCSANPSSEPVLGDIATLYDPFADNEPQASLSTFLQRNDLKEMAKCASNSLNQYTPERVVKDYEKAYERAIED